MKGQMHVWPHNDPDRWYRVTAKSAMDDALQVASDLYESYYVNGEDHARTQELLRQFVEAWDRMLE